MDSKKTGLAAVQAPSLPESNEYSVTIKQELTKDDYWFRHMTKQQLYGGHVKSLFSYE